MIDQDTSIGGSETRFPDTLRFGFPLAAEPVLLGVYWKPVYKYIRVQWKRSNEDAKDLTQGFFARVLEKDLFAGYDPARGRFRGYLRASLDNYVRNAHKAEHSAKRSLQQPLLSLDFGAAEGEIAIDAAAPAASMEDYFQSEWVRNLFSLAVEMLQRDYQARGRQVHFELFRRYDLDEDSVSSYQSLAAEFGIPIATATNWLAAARRDFRRIVLDRIRASTSSDAEFRNEVKAVLGIEA